MAGDPAPTIEVPPALAARPRDARGHVIPYTTRLSQLGVPEFGLDDEERWIECVKGQRCGLCGERIAYWITFIGGEKSAESRSFLDPPYHEACARYAIEACPFLSPTGPTTIAKPARVCLYVTRSYQIVTDGEKVGIVAAKAKRIEWFDPRPLGPLIGGLPPID